MAQVISNYAQVARLIGGSPAAGQSVVANGSGGWTWGGVLLSAANTWTGAQTFGQIVIDGISGAFNAYYSIWSASSSVLQMGVDFGGTFVFATTITPFNLSLADGSGGSTVLTPDGLTATGTVTAATVSAGVLSGIAALSHTPALPTMVPNRYYGPACSADTSADQNINTGRIYFALVYVPESGVVNRIGMTVGAAVVNDSNAVLGIYAVDPATGWPGARVAVTAPISTASAGVKEEVLAANTLAKGWYWLASNFSHQVQVRRMNTQISTMNQLMGAHGADGNFSRHFFVTHTYDGSLPATITTVPTSSLSSEGPWVFLRRV
jgi:hypothetical protein